MQISTYQNTVTTFMPVVRESIFLRNIGKAAENPHGVTAQNNIDIDLFRSNTNNNHLQYLPWIPKHVIPFSNVQCNKQHSSDFVHLNQVRLQKYRTPYEKSPGIILQTFQNKCLQVNPKPFVHTFIDVLLSFQSETYVKLSQCPATFSYSRTPNINNGS